MRLHDFARDIINRARVNCYATDASKARDALIRPFGEHDEQRASLRVAARVHAGPLLDRCEGGARPLR